MNLGLSLGLTGRAVGGASASDPVADFLEAIDGSPDSGFFDFRDASDAFTAVDENGGASFSRTDGFKPGQSATLGALFANSGTAVDRVQGAGDYTVVPYLTKDAGSGDSTDGYLLNSVGRYRSGSSASVNPATEVDGSSAATFDAFHGAMDDEAAHTVMFTGLTLTNQLRLGRGSSSFEGSIRGVAIIKEADFPSNLADVRALAIAAVEAS